MAMSAVNPQPHEGEQDTAPLVDAPVRTDPNPTGGEKHLTVGIDLAQSMNDKTHGTVHVD